MDKPTETADDLSNKLSALIKDQEIDIDLKKIIVQQLFDQQKLKDAQLADFQKFERNLTVERKKFIHSTPLIITLLGGITIFCNLISSYILSRQSSDNSTQIAILNSKISEQTSEINAKISEQSKESDARRQTLREEREFAFKIIERELAKSDDQISRAKVLLFLVRAGILNSLSRDELEKMALVDLGQPNQDIGIPPTLGGILPPRYNIAPPDPKLSANKTTARIIEIATKELNNNISEDETIDKIMTYWNTIENLDRRTINQNTPWSSAFLAWVMREAGITRIKSSAANIVMWNQALEQGLTFFPGSQAPQAGDIALFARGDARRRIAEIRTRTNAFVPTALGIVYSVNGDDFQSIEPNAGNAIRLIPRSTKAQDLVGFIRLKE